MLEGAFIVNDNLQCLFVGVSCKGRVENRVLWEE